MNYILIFFYWFILPLFNFYLWKYLGENNLLLLLNNNNNNNNNNIPKPLECSLPTHILPLQTIASGPLKFNYTYCSLYEKNNNNNNKNNNKKNNNLEIEQKYINENYQIQTSSIESELLELYKGDELAQIKSSTKVIIIKNNKNNNTSIISSQNNNKNNINDCKTIVNLAASAKAGPKTCSGIIWVENQLHSDYLLRYNIDSKKTGRFLDPIKPKTSGIFRQVAKKKGRMALSDKFLPLLKHLDAIQNIWIKLLQARDIFPGDDIVVMVVNDGEIDLFLNFACSCRAHSISLHNVFVIAASAEIVAMIRATGAIGFFHPFFARVDRRASGGYLDRVFVEMMWYKAFSLWLGLKLGYNVLFQDVDLVWFKNPFEYFHHHRNKSLSSNNQIEYTGYFSDDGQRSLRYTPFYANSGFYYLLSTSKNIYFAYLVVISFDILQATGSHQNVFTARLMETMDLVQSHSLFLNLFDFPSGVKFHHDKAFMKKILNKQFLPYIFHMCWTANKKQKLENFKSANMWYIKDSCPLETLIPPSGLIYSRVVSKIGAGSGTDYYKKVNIYDTHQKFNELSSRCCNSYNLV